MKSIEVNVHDYKLPQLKSFFKVFSASMRIEILLDIYKKDWTITELSKKFDCTAANISTHVRILERGGFVRKVPVKGMNKKILKPIYDKVKIIFSDENGKDD